MAGSRQTFEVVPPVGAYKYVKAKATISESPRSLAQRKQIYSSVVAQVAIRTLHELFEADRSESLDTIVLNAHVDAIDKAPDKRSDHASSPCGRREAPSKCSIRAGWSRSPAFER